MWKNSRFKMLSFIILSLLVFVSACSNSEQTANSVEGDQDQQSTQDPVTIEFWHTYSDTEEVVFVEQVIPLFQEKHPNITVNATRMPTEGLRQQVIAAAAGDAAPDVMRMDIVWVPEFAKLGALMPLNDQEGFDELTGGLFEAPLQTNYYDGKYYGLPLNTNTKVAIYNKALLEEAGLSEPPKTYDELVKAAKVLKGKGKYGIGIGGTAAWSILPYFWSLGGEITNEDFTKSSGYLNSKDSIAALEEIIAWNQEGLVAPTILGGEPGTWDGVKEQYLMIDDGPWFYSILGDEAMELTVPALMPEGKAGSISVVGGEDVVIFAGSKHPDAAWEFVKFLMTEEPQLIMAQTGLIPTNIEAANSDEVMKVPFIKPYVEQLKTANSRTPHPNWEKVQETFNLAIESAVRGETSPEDALNQAAQEIDAILQE